MLDAYGQQAIGLQFLRLALAIQVAHGDFVGAGHVGKNAGHGQAAFLIDLFARLVGDLRIDEDLRLVLLFTHIDDHEALVHVHLASSQADARRVVHGLEHVIQQALEGRCGDLFGRQRNRLGAQAGVRKL